MPAFPAQGLLYNGLIDPHPPPSHAPMKPPALLPMFQQLIAAPSVSSINPQWDQSNQGVIELLAGWFGDLGFRTEVLPVPGAPGKCNLLATLGSGGDGLVLAGHTDTVPCDPGLWRQDPWRLDERDGRLYGLGICDMKGFFALVAEAVRGMDLTRMERPLMVLATADEESSMGGARALVESGRRLGARAVIGEPTGLRPIRLHKGIAMQALRLHGRSGHSSNPALGVNALEGMQQAMAEILAWRGELQARYRNPLFEVAVPTLNLGHIHGGDNPNRICGFCELQFDLRPLPGMDLDQLREELSQRLGARLVESGLRLELVQPFPDVPPFETAAGAELVRVAEVLTGVAAGAVAFGTEAPYLQRLGMETIVLGPGEIAQAHQPDEYLALERIEPTVELLRRLIARFCLQ
jgi:acetylornithine deacetylase